MKLIFIIYRYIGKVFIRKLAVKFLKFCTFILNEKKGIRFLPNGKN